MSFFIQKQKEIPQERNLENSLFIILGNSEISEDRSMSLPAVVHDIANLKRAILSENIGFREENILSLLNAPKQEVLDKVQQQIQLKSWDNIVLYYSGFGMLDANKAFRIICDRFQMDDQNTFITAEEIGSWFQDMQANIIFLFDCCHAQKVFEDLYNEDVFLLGAAGESEQAQETKDGGIFTSALVDVLTNGADNGKEELALIDIYLAMREKLINIQEPEMLTTNIVQFQLLAKNTFQAAEVPPAESVEQKPKEQIEALISNNKLEEAFQQMALLIGDNDDLKDRLILFQNRFVRLKDEVILGLIARDKSNIENNQIVFGLLSLMREVAA